MVKNLMFPIGLSVFGRAVLVVYSVECCFVCTKLRIISEKTAVISLHVQNEDGEE